MEYNIFEQMTRKIEYTENELRQAGLYESYLVESGSNNDLRSFLSKAIKNNMADKMAELAEKNREAEYQERKRSLIYVD